MSRLIDLFPSVPGDPFSMQPFHPLPIAIGEVRKFRQVTFATPRAYPKSVGKTRRIAHPRLRSANAMAVPACPLQTPASTGVADVNPLVCRYDRLRLPDFEVLSPAVVIRRRPKRN